MLYIPNVGNYLKILIDEEVEDFVAIIFSEYIKCIREEKILEKLLNRFISL